MRHIVGIDLGTTYSAIAHMGEHGRPIIIPNSDHQPITPSVVCFKDGEVIVGQAAREYDAVGGYSVASGFKRQMGSRTFQFAAGGEVFSATQLSTFVLQKIKRDAETRLGGVISDAVITVPAYFQDAERRATIAAGEAAGLRVLQMINEPTAAAAAYGFGRTERPQKLLVYDLGGGTFDVTLLDLGPDGIQVITSSGDHELGGKDWDERISQFASTSFEGEFGLDPSESLESLAQLSCQAEEAKRRLSGVCETTLTVVYGGRRGKYRIDRATFENLTSDLLERTAAKTQQVLEEQGLSSREIDGVLLVGGATRMPMIERYVRTRLNQRPLAGVNVDEVVALGAALHAHRIANEEEQGNPRFAKCGGIRIVDVTNHSLGMIATNEDNSTYVNSRILAKNTRIPCSSTQAYAHRVPPEGGALEVYVTQGESYDPQNVAYLGRYLLHDVPHVSSGPTMVDITFRYDASGSVHVAGEVHGSGHTLRQTVEVVPENVPERFRQPPVVGTRHQRVTAYLAFDLSGSMAGDPLRDAKRAAHGFLQNIDLENCALGIIAFSDRVRTKLSASQNANEIKQAIDGLCCGETGGGNEGDPFDEALKLLGGVNDRRFVITLADGIWSDQPRAIRGAKVCHKAGIESIAIGFGSADSSFLREIASCDEASFFTTASGLLDTFSSIAQVITESVANAGSFRARLRDKVK